VAEIIHPQDGDAVELQPCAAWCTLNPHFADDDVIHREDGLAFDRSEERFGQGVVRALTG
jgi:hypothetical protein